MMVLNKLCKKCNYACYAIHFQHKFIDWTSGNDDIDNFIQDTQLSTHNNNNVKEAIEWIPYDRLYDIKYIKKDKFGEVYRANLIDGYIFCWDNINQNWMRRGYNMFVNLKSLNIPKKLTLKFTNEVNKII
jgi:hypothetical protein